MNPARLLEIARVFLRLGLTSFGGPVAHLGYFRKECVERLHWIDDQDYADIMAVCQFLPGPTSSQAVFLLGMKRGGFAGAVLASLCFSLPSLVLMIAFAYGVADMAALARSGALHGLRVAAVAVVAFAFVGTAIRLCNEWRRAAMAAAVMILLILYPGVVTQLLSIAGCALLAWAIRLAPSGPAPPPAERSGHGLALASAVAFVALLAVLPLASARWGGPAATADSFYRSGALVFGGGHVVLPLLRSEMAAHGWVGDAPFMAGYGAAQALPGPLFTFAGYLGCLIHGGPGAWIGGVWAAFFLFLPGWLVVGGVYPFWKSVRSFPGMRSALAGIGAAVVGLLGAALYRPVATEALHGWADAAAAVGALLLLFKARMPSWVLVIAMAAVGQWLLPLLPF
jgi:chromate transporter